VISLRFSQWKMTDYTTRSASSPLELEVMLQVLSQAGVDLFHASTRRFGQPEWPADSPLSLAGWTRKLTGKPVIAVGGVGLSVDMVETFTGMESQGPPQINFAGLAKAFHGQEFDLISVGRSNIADPDWVSKVRDGRWEEIRQFRFADLGAVAEEALAASMKGA
jgi:2,4-dienoyl-CoA reductase-like NADH-dependent reductase (Old Yellow Enzyme family)